MARRKYADKLAYIVKSIPASRQIRDPFEQFYIAGRAIEPPLPPEQLLVLAEENAIHAACLKAKVDDAIGRGWQIVGDDVESYDEVRAKLEEITPDWTFEELLQAAVWELEAIGWAAWEVVRSGLQIAAIYPMPAHTIRATRDPTRYVQIRGGIQREFALFGTAAADEDISEIILFRSYSARSPYYGVPRWIAAIPAIAELTAIREYNVSWFASGGMADRIINVVSPSVAEARQIAEEIKTALRESSGRGHVSIIVASSTDSSVNVQFLSPQVGRREGQFIRRREDLVKEILMAHGVPPYRIGWAEMGQLAGNAAREMIGAYRLGVIEPLQTVIESRLNQTLFGPKGLNLRGRWKLRDLSWEETELNLKIATDGIERGILTPNEARQLLGYDIADDPALDAFYLAQNLQAIGQQPEVQKAIDVLKEFRDALQAAIAEE